LSGSRTWYVTAFAGDKQTRETECDDQDAAQAMADMWLAHNTALTQVIISSERGGQRSLERSLCRFPDGSVQDISALDSNPLVAAQKAARVMAEQDRRRRIFLPSDLKR
jgi:hypothetical protein